MQKLGAKILGGTDFHVIEEGTDVGEIELKSTR